MRLYGSRLAVLPPMIIKSDSSRNCLKRLRSSSVDRGIDEPAKVVAPDLPTIKFAVVIRALIGSRLASVSGYSYPLTMIINCQTCVMREIACGDCVISVLLEIKPLPGKNAELTKGDEAAINLLANAGLVPPLRFKAGRNLKLRNIG